MKYIISISLILLCSCSFFVSHPKFVQDAEKLGEDIGKVIIEDVSEDLVSDSPDAQKEEVKNP